jgi:predicted lipoprotein
MKVKAFLVLAAVLVATGCAGGLKRLAPPGIVKYEDLEKDTPVNPVIAARVEEYKDKEAGGFPKLAEQPQEPPVGIAPPERIAMEEGLIALRTELTASIEADRVAAAAERESSIATLAEQLDAAIAVDDAQARAERGQPPRTEASKVTE